MFNMIHNALMVKVDCVVRKDTAYRREEFARRKTVTVAGQHISMVAPEDLGSEMKDTPPDVDERYHAMLMQRTGEERLIMGCAMRDTVRALVEASLREHDPQVSVVNLRKGVFLRFYGHEFDPETMAKILSAIEQATPKP